MGFVGDGAKRPLSSVVAILISTLAVLAVAIAAYAALVGEDASGPRIAQGVTGGAFHPVAGNFAPDGRVLDDCGEDYSCLQQAFGNVAYREGVKHALALFDAEIARNEHVRRDCHRIAHLIGSAAFARFDGDVARTFSVGSSTCASGYYHGILERAFVGVNTRTKLVDVARALCSGSGIRRRSFLDYQCRHGLGHGLMIQTGYDLPVSLATCAELDTRWDDVVCTGGVFMENVTTRFGYRSSWLKDDDPLYPCDRVPQRNRRSCFLRSSVRIIAFHKNDFAKAAETCAGLSPHWSRACFRGYGRDAVGEARYAPAKILSLCGLARTGQADCLFGAARTVGDGFGVAGARRSARLCLRAPRPGRDSCFGGVGIIVGLLYATDTARREACATLAAGHAQTCARAAIAEVNADGRAAWG